MAILGLSAFKYTSDWEYDTSEDLSISAIATISLGRLKLKNPVQGRNMTLKYRCVSAGLSKGLPIGVSQSQFTDPSGGYGSVVCDQYFDELSFPCRGWILSVGATLGVFQEGSGTNGAAGNIYFFGLWPFAALRAVGAFAATTPGGGIGVGAAGFALDDGT